MGKPRTITVSEDILELKALKSKMKGARLLGRLNFLILLKEPGDITMAQMAERLGVSPRTLDNWSATYRSLGMDGLLKRETRQKPSRLIPVEVHQALARRLEDPESSFLGYWDAHQWVGEQFAIQISYNWLREYMREKFGSRLKMPRRSNVKKDERAVEVFKKPYIHV